MNTKLGIIHTSATLVPVFQKLCSEKLPGISTFHISDDSLIKDVIARNELTATTARRVSDHIGSAETAGATHILVTCSSIGPAVEAAVPFTGVPVLRVDQPMADKAVQTGSRIGVIATLPTTLNPTKDLVERRAALKGKSITLHAHLCEGAFEALMKGNAEEHDNKVQEGLKALMNDVDVIVLAQASMARVVESLPPEERVIPILASPELAIEHLAGILS